MKKVRILAICFFLISLTFVLNAKVSCAKTFAYLVGTDGSVTKIDTDTNTVISKASLEKSSHVQEGDKSVIADQANSHLLVVTGRLMPSITIYDLKTLKFIKDLGIISGNPDIDILVSPNGKQLFINWFDSKEEGWRFDLFDAINLTFTRHFTDFVWGTITTFSSDGSKILTYDGETDKFRIWDVSNFTLLNTIDLNTVWKQTTFAQGIEDVKDEKIMISETDKTALTDQPIDTLFVYDLNTRTSSLRIPTGVSGSEKLSPNKTSIILSEEQNIWSSDKSYIMYQKSMGKLHVYDVATGKETGSVQFTVDRESKIIGIHPRGTKVYVKGDIQGVKSLLVLDVVNFKVIKTIEIPDTILFMIFYEE